MALSLVVLLIPVFLIMLMYRTLYGGDTVVTVDPTETVASAGRAGFTQLPPTSAPQGWLIVSAEFSDDVLRIGYLDQDRHGVQLVQARGALNVSNEGETLLTGTSGDMTVMLVTQEANLTPLAEMLPIPVGRYLEPSLRGAYAPTSGADATHPL